MDLLVPDPVGPVNCPQRVQQMYEEEYVLTERLSPEDKLLYNRFKKSKKGMSEEDIKRRVKYGVES